jgi:hypothetical protein
MPKAVAAGLLARTPLGRIDTPEDIVPVVALIQSHGAPFVTGQVLGLTADLCGMTAGLLGKARRNSRQKHALPAALGNALTTCQASDGVRRKMLGERPVQRRNA